MSAAFLLFCGQAPLASAVEVLLNGGLENSTGPATWTLTQSVAFPAQGDYNGNGTVDAADYVLFRNGGPIQNEVPEVTTGSVTPEDYDAWRARFGNAGSTSTQIAATEQIDAAAYPMPADGELGLLLRPFSGNTGDYENLNGRVNVTLSRVFSFGAAAANRTYKFVGHSYFQVASSNNLTTLYADSPSGAVPSPTETYFELAFLNASDQVLGSPTRLDLPRNRATDTLPTDWQEHMVSALAPAGTTKIRMTAAAKNMVASCTTACPGGQDVYFDNFSLFDSSVPSLDRINGGDPPANGNLNLPGAPENWILEKTAQDNVQFSNQSYARHSGNVGMWLRAFAGGDAKISQVVAATAGSQYTYSGWSKWELGYNGGDPLSNVTQTFARMEFLDSATSTTPLQTVSLDLKTVLQNNDTWTQFTLPTTTAPAGTLFVRVVTGAASMANSGFNPQSAMFDDFSLIKVGSGSGNLLADLVPEPTSALLALMGMSAVLSLRRR